MNKPYSHDQSIPVVDPDLGQGTIPVVQSPMQDSSINGGYSSYGPAPTEQPEFDLGGELARKLNNTSGRGPDNSSTVRPEDGGE